MYQVQFSDGMIQDYSANHIAEAISAVVNNEGNQFVLIDEILDYHYMKEAITPEQAWTVGSNGNCHRIKTTKGCQLCVRWKDDTTSWETLAILKNSHPFEVSRFAMDRNLLPRPCICLVGTSLFGYYAPDW
jgi:hypothetical protein